jgi:hypothetical protein
LDLYEREKRHGRAQIADRIAGMDGMELQSEGAPNQSQELFLMQDSEVETKIWLCVTPLI